MAARVWSSTVHLLLIAMSAVPFATADYFCGVNNACYMTPSGCTYGDCDFEVVWSQQENSTWYDFKIAARTTGWAAFGISADKYMGDDDVYMCIVEGDGARFEHRFNQGRNSIKLGLPGATHSGLRDAERRYVNGVVSCRIERDVSLTNSGLVVNLTSDWYMFFAEGPTDESGIPQQHTKIPKMTKEKINFSELPVLSPDDLDDPNDNGGATALQTGFLLMLCSAVLVLMDIQM